MKRAAAAKGAPKGALKGKKALVTGGGTGIGAGIALALAQAGADVAVLGRRRAPLQKTVLAIEAAGRKGVAVTADVTDRAAVARAVARAAKALGGLDALVNNAGVGGPNGCGVPGPDRWDQIVRTNLDGVYFATAAALAHVPDGGRIVNISSVLGKFGVPGYTAYCASKHGVIGLTRALALELAPRGITVNAVCPGWVETSMAKDGMERIAEASGVSYDEARAGALGMVPMGQMIVPQEIGDLVAYLASDAARNLTAQALSLCGGSTW